MSSASRLLSFRLSGTSPLTMRQGEPLDDGGLADAGLSDEDGVVLGAPRRTWIARPISSSRPMTGRALPFARRLGEAAAYFFRAS